VQYLLPSYYLRTVTRIYDILRVYDATRLKWSRSRVVVMNNRTVRCFSKVQLDLMAENQRPQAPVSNSPRIDLATVSKDRMQKRLSQAPQSPMATDRNYNVDKRVQLISPPPEETLRRVSVGQSTLNHL
jgi:hypothetical protein